ncbi:MAG: tetratricopeptide repeat protein, partial [bacterium]
VHLRSERYEEARDAYLESFRINPFNPGIHRGLALAYGKLGETRKAKETEETFRRLVRGLRRRLSPTGPPKPKKAN